MRELGCISSCHRWLLAIGVTFGISSGIAVPSAGASGDSSIVMESPNFDTNSTAAIVMEGDKRWVSSASIPADGKGLLRTLPSLSKEISVGGTTLVPYIGAGFRGGYATEFDRSLNTALSPSSSSSSPADVGLKSLAGHMIPNEVQLGIRFPF